MTNKGSSPEPIRLIGRNRSQRVLPSEGMR